MLTDLFYFLLDGAGVDRFQIMLWKCDLLKANSDPAEARIRDLSAKNQRHLPPV